MRQHSQRGLADIGKYGPPQSGMEKKKKKKKTERDSEVSIERSLA